MWCPGCHLASRSRFGSGKLGCVGLPASLDQVEQPCRIVLQSPADSVLDLGATAWGECVARPIILIVCCWPGQEVL